MDKPNPTSHSQILWVEGRWTGNPGFVLQLREKGFFIDTVATGKKALELADNSSYDLVIVNAASMRTSGARICKTLRDNYQKLPIILICESDRVATGMNDIINRLLVLPFTTRKLVNRIMPLLPGDKGNMNKVGPIFLDLDRGRVTCNDRQTVLTPRLVRLLNEFMNQNGRVLQREDIFKRVWKTDYVGDTRTLDVHISWLRQAIEKDPRNPELLKTVRGVGYRLDV